MGSGGGSGGGVCGGGGLDSGIGGGSFGSVSFVLAVFNYLLTLISDSFNFSRLSTHHSHRSSHFKFLIFTNFLLSIALSLSLSLSFSKWGGESCLMNFASAIKVQVTKALD